MYFKVDLKSNLHTIEKHTMSVFTLRMRKSEVKDGPKAALPPPAFLTAILSDWGSK